MKSLFIKQFIDERLGNSSYLIASEESKIAAVIDPQRDIEKYIQVIDELGLKLNYVLDTHLHADFISGSQELKHHPGFEDIRIGLGAKAKARFKHVPLNEGDKLSLGNLSIDVIETPGHAPEHISFLIHTQEESILFSGGSLIVGGTGRTDLLGNEFAEELAHLLYDTIHNKLALLTDDVIVYPTHGAGSFCNTTSSGARVTTIGQERQNNPFLKFSDEKEFVAYALNGLSNYPKYYQHLREVNQKGVRVLGSNGVPTPEPLSVEEVKHHLKAGAVIVDVRDTDCFLESHIEGSYGIPLVTPLNIWAGWVIPFGASIILLTQTPTERVEATRQLIRIGYDDIRGYLEGGIQAWEENGQALVSTKSINAEELKDWLSQKNAPTVLDVRFNKEWHNGHIAGAKHVEAGILQDVAHSLLHIQKDDPLVVHCQRGNRSTIALSILEQKGFKNIYALEAGIQSWVHAGYELSLNGNNKTHE